MRILEARFKGLKGIFRGMGLDEIKLNISQFEKGLIAIQGTNETGKSTLMYNLHPCASIPHAKGKLQDQFRLRESEKEIIWEDAGIKYRTLILIDAKTAKIEGYLYQGEEQKPLANGSITDYRRELEKIIGTDEMFYNANFTSRKIYPITQREPSKRKDMFYEFMGSELGKFEIMDLMVKKKQDVAQTELTDITAKIDLVNEQMQKLPTAETIAEQLQRNAEQEETATEELSNQYENLKFYESEIITKTHELGLVEKTQAQLVELNAQKTELSSTRETAIASHSTTVNELIGNLTTLSSDITRKKKILENSAKIETALDQIAELETEINTNIPKARHNRAIIEKQIADLNLAYQKALSEYESQCSKVKAQYAREEAEARQKHSEEQADYQSDLAIYTNLMREIEDRINAIIAEIDEEFHTLTLEYRSKMEEIGKLESGLKAIEQEAKLETKMYEQMVSSLKWNLAEQQKSAALIDTVPCGQNAEYVGSCLLLKNARDSKAKVVEFETLIATEEKRHTEALEAIEDKRLSHALYIAEKHANAIEPDAPHAEKRKNELRAQCETEKQGYSKPTPVDEKLFAAQIENIKQNIKSELDKLTKPEEPDTFAETMQIKKLNVIISSESTQQEKLKSLKAQKWEELKKELSEATIILPEKEKALAALNERIASETRRHTETLQSIEAQVKQLTEQINKLSDIADRTKIEKAIETLNDQKKAIEESIKELREDQTAISETKVKLNAISDARKELTAQLKIYCNTKHIAEEKLLRLAFIREGLGKNGIPALIIHSAGIEISNIANEFLRNADCGLRINFETLKFRNDGGSKETFEISVHYINGEHEDVEVSYINDGGTVWIDEAVFQAFGVYLATKKGSIRYECAYVDEKDGALAPEFKLTYLRMVEESFRLGNRYYTFIISHSEELWRAIPQRIHLHKDGRIDIVK